MTTRCRDCNDNPCICKTESELFGLVADVIAEVRGDDGISVEVAVMGLNLSREDTRFVTRIATGELRKERQATRWVEQQEPDHLC